MLLFLLLFTFKDVCKLFRRASPLLLYSPGNFYTFQRSAFLMHIVLFNKIISDITRKGERGSGERKASTGSRKKKKNGTTQGMGNEFRILVSIFHFLVSRAISSKIKVRRVWSSFGSELFKVLEMFQYLRLPLKQLPLSWKEFSWSLLTKQITIN